MDANAVFAQVRPILQLAGSIFFILALAKFFGLAVPYDLVSLAIAGFACKQI